MGNMPNKGYDRKYCYKYRLEEAPLPLAKKLSNGRGWSDYRIEQEKRQRAIEEMVAENTPEPMSLSATFFYFLLICVILALITVG